MDKIMKKIADIFLRLIAPILIDYIIEHLDELKKKLIREAVVENEEKTNSLRTNAVQAKEIK